MSALAWLVWGLIALGCTAEVVADEWSRIRVNLALLLIRAGGGRRG